MSAIGVTDLTDLTGVTGAIGTRTVDTIGIETSVAGAVRAGESAGQVQGAQAHAVGKRRAAATRGVRGALDVVAVGR